MADSYVGTVGLFQVYRTIGHHTQIQGKMDALERLIVEGLKQARMELWQCDVGLPMLRWGGLYAGRDVAVRFPAVAKLNADEVARRFMIYPWVGDAQPEFADGTYSTLLIEVSAKDRRRKNAFKSALETCIQHIDGLDSSLRTNLAAAAGKTPPQTI